MLISWNYLYFDNPLIHQKDDLNKPAYFTVTGNCINVL